MSGRLLLAAASVALLSAFVACDARRPAPASATIAQRADAIQGGSADTTSTFAVSVLDDQDDICSGTLIAPNLVLTARHCVATDNGGDTVDCAHDQFDAPSAASTLRVSLKATAPSFDEAEYQATKVIVPTSAAFCGNDFALLILDKLVPAAAATPATPAIDPAAHRSHEVRLEDDGHRLRHHRPEPERRRDSPRAAQRSHHVHSRRHAARLRPCRVRDDRRRDGRRQRAL